MLDPCVWSKRTLSAIVAALLGLDNPINRIGSLPNRNDSPECRTKSRFSELRSEYFGGVALHQIQSSSNPCQKTFWYNGVSCFEVLVCLDTSVDSKDAVHRYVYRTRYHELVVCLPHFLGLCEGINCSAGQRIYIHEDLMMAFLR